MTKEIITAILQFLTRVNLTGTEAPSFMKCVYELNKLLEEEKKE